MEICLIFVGACTVVSATHPVRLRGKCASLPDELVIEVHETVKAAEKAAEQTPTWVVDPGKVLLMASSIVVLSILLQTITCHNQVMDIILTHTRLCPYAKNCAQAGIHVHGDVHIRRV